MWIARDEDGSLYLYAEKPFKEEFLWDKDFCEERFIELDRKLFPDVTWEDEEPLEVEVVIKGKGSEP